MEPELIIPEDRLPPGFAERVLRPEGPPAEPRPAATVVLVRAGETAPELLLLKRHGSSGFVPGAYVFAGGRVDEADGDVALIALLADPPSQPEPAYWLAGIREVFEETGVLLARDAAGAACPDATRDAAMARWREDLLLEQATLLDVLTALDVRPDISRSVYCAHWITPLAEPRRYDTRFFLAELPEGCEARADPREMSDALWVTARQALDRFRAGRLPMVFPTVKTIERLEPHASVAAMLNAFRSAEIQPQLPRLVRRPDGIGIVLPRDLDKDEESESGTA